MSTHPSHTEMPTCGVQKVRAVPRVQPLKFFPLPPFINAQCQQPIGNETLFLAGRFTRLRSARQEHHGPQLPASPSPRAPHTHHRSRCIACSLSGSLGGNMVGRIWVCLPRGTASHSENHCPSLVMTCEHEGRRPSYRLFPTIRNHMALM